MKRALLVVLAFLLTGCGSSGVYGMPLPGGADLGDYPYKVTVEFPDVLDLVPHAAVKVNDVPVGRVDEITLAPDGSAARVVVQVNGNVVLNADTRAELRSASLLGEKFVALVPPPYPASGRLQPGAVIPLSGSKRYPEVEEVFGALSMLLNGGGVGQVRDIVHELNLAAGGNEPQLRDLLTQLGRTTGQLNARRDTIVRSIDAIDRLSASFAQQTNNINTSLDRLEPGLGVLADQRGQLVDALRSLDRLGVVATSTVNRAGDDLVADLRSLEPVLHQLNKAGPDIPNSLQFLLTFPFTDYALKAVGGDYVNVDVLVDLDLSALLGSLLRSSQPFLPIPGTASNPLPGPLGELLPAPKPKAPAGLGGLLGPLGGGDR
ncbi:MCE family protein [Pseudonocardia eucalypti]|uniref:MCE family protein n=1 Tax=Pseudonocardia eucalypti TaxID=648755 RepID=A0ABP9QYE3_9PSEU|nr:phospholipid/cholesterol/gamma-HCH transport system substrate-binding protein [Pseudonocardia eucalypti]